MFFVRHRHVGAMNCDRTPFMRDDAPSNLREDNQDQLRDKVAARTAEMETARPPARSERHRQRALASAATG
jgi:hypothetical protein